MGDDGARTNEEVDVMVPVQILGVYLDPNSGSSIVLLGEPSDVTRVLPIFIGPAEAQAIAIGIAEVEMPRPGTHDLMVEIINRWHARLVEVDVTELRDGTFFAELELATADGTQRVSSRPSDGIALAVRVGAPIMVAQRVLDTAAVGVERGDDEPFDAAQIEAIVAEFQDFLATAEPEDFGAPGGPPAEETP
ncbi:MAG: bifunctional nuclease family protein [Ilumatobacter sp.]|nr:bifunctional nuclease family protein [Ilumatobacter sp.]